MSKSLIDWEHGCWHKSSEISSVEQRIIIAGDWAPIRRYESLMLSDPLAVYGDLLPLLCGADMRIVNVEAALSDRGTPTLKDGPNLRGRPEAADALAAVPFDVGCLANNHVMDYGPTALADTRALLAEHGIHTVGAGLSRNEALSPLLLSVGDTRIGIVDFCEGEDGTSAMDGPGVFGWEIATVVDVVKDLRERVDVLIVVAHAGREYTPAPPPYVQRVYRAVARAGADVVVGHHPHVPQGVEIYEGVPILYSLGNFVFYQDTETLFRRRGIMVSLELTGGALSGLSLVPYALDKGELRRLKDREKVWFLDRLRSVAEPLQRPSQVADLWHAYIDSRGEEFWRESSGGIAALAKAAGEDVDQAAALRNRFMTPAHHHFIADGLGRSIAGEIGTSPAWARDLVDMWMNLTRTEAGNQDSVDAT
jgi:Bacterial capsule synthesis protein PGA_cap